MKKNRLIGLILSLMVVSHISQAQSNKGDTIVLSLYNNSSKYMLTLADFGPTVLSQNILGEMVAAYDTIITFKSIRKVDTLKDKSPRYTITRSCNKPFDEDIKDKIVIMDLNKDCDVTLMCLNVQRAGAKAFVIIHNSNTKGTIKLPKQGLYKESIRIPIFTVRKGIGEQLVSMLPSQVGISLKKANPTQKLASPLVLSLEAKAEIDKAKLSWINNTGGQNDYFVVQRLNPITGIFEDKQTLNSQLTGGLEDYASTDDEPIDGENIYRIKLVLLDGTVHYSEPQKVKFNTTETVKIFPNPTDDMLNISFKGYTNMSVDITIFDMQGKQIWTQKYNKLETSHLSLPVASQSVAGQYMLLIRSKGKRDVIRTFTVF